MLKSVICHGLKFEMENLGFIRLNWCAKLVWEARCNKFLSGDLRCKAIQCLDQIITGTSNLEEKTNKQTNTHKYDNTWSCGENDKTEKI